MKHGDDNTTLCFNSIKQRRLTNRINLLIVDGKSISDPLDINVAFLSFYSDLLCSHLKDRRKINMQVINAGFTLSSEMGKLLEEIKGALWSINDNKAPGLDGFNSKFYKAAWPVIWMTLLLPFNPSLELANF